MSEQHSKMFMVPSPLLGRTEDVYPERITAASNDWIELSRQILQKKRQAAKKGQWRPPYPIDDEARDLHPFGAQYCPALQETHQVGYVLKWPATAILRRVAEKGWQLKPSTNYNFYKYHAMTSFAEAGEAEAISVDTGWSILTPPGWSILCKAVPNNLAGLPGGMQFAEGIIRSDQAVIGLQVHARIPESAPDEIRIKRGDPMLLLFPFRRETLDLAVMEDEASVDEAKKLVERLTQGSDKGPGLYRRLYIEDYNPTPLYNRLYERWRARSGDEESDAPAETAAAPESAEDAEGARPSDDADGSETD